MNVQFSVECLNVGVMCTIGPRRFSGFFETLGQSHPQIEVTLHDVTAAMIPELLLSGSLDCMFCAHAAKHDQRFNSVDLFSESMVIAFADGHRFGDFEIVPLAEVAKEPYLDRLHCEFRDDFMNFTKGSGLTLDIALRSEREDWALRSEREDWILEPLRSGIGVCGMPTNSVILDAVNHRPVSELVNVRNLELVMTADTTNSFALAAFRDAAAHFDWDEAGSTPAAA